MSLNDPKRQRRRVPLPRDAKRGVFRPSPFASHVPADSNVDSMLADAVNDVICQDIRKELARPSAVDPLLHADISDIEQQAQQLLEPSAPVPRHGRRRPSEAGEEPCLSARSEPAGGDRGSQYGLQKQLEDAERKIQALTAENKHKSALLELERRKLAAVKHESEDKVEKKLVMRIEKENRRLTQQISAMEQFLADYGLKWVGDTSPPGSPHGSAPGSPNCPAASAAGNWVPAAAIPTEQPSDEMEYPFDFAKLRRNVDELNMLGGDGQSDIKKVGGGDFRLERKSRLALTFWKNGFQINHAAFRPYSMKHNRAFVQDILEGYFPYELKEKYPNGVPFDVHDRTWEEFNGGRSHRPFSQAGEGQRLGDGARQANLPHLVDRLLMAYRPLDLPLD